ncbi:MAG: hypothetical protein C0487_19090 [Leptothrix sp. (in: Bacteria)]|nr:hypothetical protein [Leptothrix sp. (in: b-proteobacteria)]
MKNPSLKALSLAVATLVVQSQAQAAPTNAELNSVKLYGNVTIAQDSVNGWGPWTEFEPPAAGNPPLAQLPTTPDPYRTLPQAAAGSVVVPLPELLGFGAFYTLITKPGAPDLIDGPHPINVSGTTITPTTTASWMPDSFQMDIAPITGAYPPPNSMPLALQEGVYANTTENGQTSLTLVENPDDPGDAEANQVSFYKFLSYLRSPEDRAPQVITQLGVIGRPTSAADMAELKARNFSGTYTGYSLTNGGGFAPMTMDVNLAGEGSWSGTWNNGVTANGVVGFSVTDGAINGSTFSTTAASKFSPNTTGSINGGFYGANASALGGVADITQNGTRYVDPFRATLQQNTATVPQTPTVGAAQ